jgi:hypothetical protein
MYHRIKDMKVIKCPEWERVYEAWLSLVKAWGPGIEASLREVFKLEI